MTAYIHHVTLQTGHVARQSRAEVGDAAIAALSDLLDSALTGGRPAVPGFVTYAVTGAQQGRDLVATLWRGDAPILTTAVALRSRSAPALWRLLHHGRDDLATDPESPPPAPWCADRLEVGALLHREALAWTGDYARCLAWAWVAYRTGGHADDR